jgi:hypothetical protein
MRSGGQAVILVGHDDQTWDIAVAVPSATVDETTSLAEQEHAQRNPITFLLRQDPQDRA